MTYPLPPIYYSGDERMKQIEDEFNTYVTKEDLDRIAKKNKYFNVISREFSCDLGKVSKIFLF